MASFTTHLLSISSNIKSLGNGQDYIFNGEYIDAENNRKVIHASLFDGHGPDQAIDIIRSSDLSEIMKDENPHIALQYIVDADKKSSSLEKLKSGSTMVYVKVYEYIDKTEIIFSNIGDSQGLLWINGELVYKTTPQNCENPLEMKRLIDEARVSKYAPIYKNGSSIEVLSQTEIISKVGTYVSFITKNYNKYYLSPSQSIGHCGITGFAPEIAKFTISPDTQFRIMLFSDGVGDMLPISLESSLEFLKHAPGAEDVINKAESIWKQEWTIYPNGNKDKTYTTTFDNNGYDDCSCVIIEKN